MLEFIATVREWLNGKKTYLTAAAAIITAVVGWAEGSVSADVTVTAILGALSLMFSRAGVKKAENAAKK